MFKIWRSTYMHTLVEEPLLLVIRVRVRAGGTYICILSAPRGAGVGGGRGSLSSLLQARLAREKSTEKRRGQVCVESYVTPNLEE